jgi:hypothetical protein
MEADLELDERQPGGRWRLTYSSASSSAAQAEAYNSAIEQAAENFILVDNVRDLVMEEVKKKVERVRWRSRVEKVGRDTLMDLY